MREVCSLIWLALVGAFRLRAALEAENTILRHQLNVFGSIRRECLDHVIVFSERHLRHLLLCYMKYYNGARTHLSLEKDAPVSRAVDRAGHILCRPTLGGLHHQYARI